MKHVMLLSATWVFLTASADWGLGVHAQSSNEIVLRVTGLTPDLVAYVAKVGEPRIIHVSKGSDLFGLITENCGSANTRQLYLPIFIGSNSNNDDIRAMAAKAAGAGGDPISFITTKAADFVLPACVFASDSVGTTSESVVGPKVAGGFKAVVASSVVQLGSPCIGASEFCSADIGPAPSLVSQVVSRIVGSSDILLSTERLENALRVQDVESGNDVNKLRRFPLEPNLSGVSRPSRLASFPLRAGLDAAAVVDGMPKNAVTGSSVWSGFRSYTSVEGEACTGRIADNPWPFDLRELIKVFRLRAEVGQPAEPRGLILVFDSGFPPDKVDTAPFGRKLFRADTKAVDSGDTVTNYVWSATDEPSLYFNPVPNSDFNYHGIAVASLALGGVDGLQEHFLTQSGTLGSRGFIALMMGFDIQNGSLVPNKEAVSRTLTRASWGGAPINVVNMSVSFSATTAMGEEANVQSAADTLFIFPAGEPSGNGQAQDVSFSKVRPAMWGGRNSPNVITVGSIDGDDHYSTFSNFGEAVDIAAPGCKVPVIWWNNITGNFDSVVKTGTSFAAPLVSFAANLLSNDNDYRSSAAVKARLIGSGRFSNSIAGKVWSNKALDIPTALATPFDVVRYRDGTVAYGRIEWDSVGMNISGRLKTRTDVKQIGYFDSSTNNREQGVSGTVQLVEVPDTNQPEKIMIERSPPTLYDGELSQLVFRPIDDEAVPPKLGNAISLDIRDIESVTLCDRGLCWTP